MVWREDALRAGRKRSVVEQRAEKRALRAGDRMLSQRAAARIRAARDKPTGRPELLREARFGWEPVVLGTAVTALLYFLGAILDWLVS